MAKSKAKPAKSEPFSAGMYSVAGRLFRTRAEALSYCEAHRIPAFRVELVPPAAADLLDPVKLSVREGWRLRVFLDGPEPVLIVEHAEAAQAFKVRFGDLVDLVALVRARVRELAREGEL